MTNSAVRSKDTAPIEKTQLRFLTCGSVDDGKSTLIGRILYDSKAVMDDQVSQSKIESARYGTQGDSLDLALLVDGLQAEREQGITIDVAYRFSKQNRGNSLPLILQATSNTHEIWLPVPRM